MALDGSFIRLPADQALINYYGALGHDGTAATALASLLYDVENDIIVDAKLEPITKDERSLAHEHIKALEKMESYKNGHRGMLIFDLGYPS
jgi:hypothetical protein